MEVGCYTMDLYCDSDRPHKYGEFPHQYCGHTQGNCKRKAKRNGWTFVSDESNSKVFCPECSKAMKQEKKAAIRKAKGGE
jgi:hypothetical protein